MFTVRPDYTRRATSTIILWFNFKVSWQSFLESAVFPHFTLWHAEIFQNCSFCLSSIKATSASGHRCQLWTDGAVWPVRDARYTRQQMAGRCPVNSNKTQPSLLHEDKNASGASWGRKWASQTVWCPPAAHSFVDWCTHNHNASLSFLSHSAACFQDHSAVTSIFHPSESSRYRTYWDLLANSQFLLLSNRKDAFKPSWSTKDVSL